MGFIFTNNNIMTKKLLKFLMLVLALCFNVSSVMADWVPVSSWDKLAELLRTSTVSDTPLMIRLSKDIKKEYTVDRDELVLSDGYTRNELNVTGNVILDLNGHALLCGRNVSHPTYCNKYTVKDERSVYMIIVDRNATLRVFDNSKAGTGIIMYDGKVMKPEVSTGYCYKKDSYCHQYRNLALVRGKFELYGGRLVAGGTPYIAKLTKDNASICEGPSACDPNNLAGIRYVECDVYKVVNGNGITMSGENAEVNIYGGTIEANGFMLGNVDGENGCVNRPCYCINDMATYLKVTDTYASVKHPNQPNKIYRTGAQKSVYSESLLNDDDAVYKDSLICRKKVHLYGGTYIANHGANLSPVAIDNYTFNKRMSLKYYPANGVFHRDALTGTIKMMLPCLHMGGFETIKEPQGILAKHGLYYRWMEPSRMDHCDKKDAKYQAYQTQSTEKVKGNAADYCTFKSLPFGYSVDKISTIENAKFPVSGNTTLQFAYDTLPTMLQQMGYELIPYVKYKFSTDDKEVTLDKTSTFAYKASMKDGYMICGLKLAKRVRFANGDGIDSYDVPNTIEAKLNIVYEEVVIDPKTFIPSISKQPTDITTGLDSLNLTIAAKNVSSYSWYVVGDKSDVLFANTSTASYVETNPARIASLAGKKMYCRVNNGSNYAISDTFSVTCYVPTAISIRNYSFPYGKENRKREEEVKDLKVYYHNFGQDLCECGLKVSEIIYAMFKKTLYLPFEVKDSVDIAFVIEKLPGWEYKNGKSPAPVYVANTASDFSTVYSETTGNWMACVTGHIIQPDPAGYPLTQIQYLNKTTLCDSIPFPNAVDGEKIGGAKKKYVYDNADIVSTTWYDSKHNVKTSEDTLTDGYYEEVIVMVPSEDYYYFVDTLTVNTKVDFLSLEKKEVTVARYYQVEGGVATQIDCVPFDVVASANKNDYGTVSLTRNGNHIRIAAVANEGYKLAYWEDSKSNVYLAEDSVYEADIIEDFDLTAVFAPIVKSIVVKDIVAPKKGDTGEGALYPATVTTEEGSYETEIGGFWSDTIANKESGALTVLIIYALSKQESLEAMAPGTTPYTVKADTIDFILMASKIAGVDESTEVYINDMKVGGVLNLYGQYIFAYAKFVSGGEITGVAETSVDPAINAYLNSTNSTLYVDGVEGATLTISSILGVEVYKNANAAKLTEINVSNWANGVYLINVVENGLNKTIKFVKK